jgi:phosphoglycolate phosphatase
MLFRGSKENDINKGKWIGVGGKLEGGETAGECVRREVKEETGLNPSCFIFHGILYFRNDRYEDEEIYLYTAEISDEEADHIRYDCDEGTLRFIDSDRILELDLWEGDRVFLKDLLDGKKHISYELIYEGDRLIRHERIKVSEVLFDFDGTLVDTGEGIMKCAQYSLESIGIIVEDPKELSFFVGPPLLYTYMHRYGADETQARALIDKYRERYNPIGVYECELYPGVRDCIEKLRDMGYHIGIASSKPEHMCVTLLDHFGISDLFDDVVGATPDGRIDTKTEVLNELLRRKSEDREYISRCVLIGDTGFDIRGAMDVGVSAIGVSFGYGDVSEMSSLGAVDIADSMGDLPEIIRGLDD